MEDKPLKDLYFTEEILHDSNLTNSEKIFMATYLMNNKDMAETERDMFDYKKANLSKIKKNLEKKGYIKKCNYTVEELKDKTIEIAHTGNKCEWCGKESYVLQEHHYPIPARNGGTKVVHICPNCHYTFHALEGNFYE